jgi:hypothetical protein
MTTASEMDAQAAAASAEHKKKLRRAVAIGVGGVVGTIAFLLVTFWVGSWVSSPATVTNVNTNRNINQPVLSQTSNCDGVQRTHTLSGAGSLINGGAHCELVAWGRDSDVMVYGAGGNKNFPAGSGGTFAFTATHWKCASVSSCNVAAIFCPARHAWDDTRKVCRPPV